MIWKRYNKCFMALLLCCSLLFGTMISVPVNAETEQTAEKIVDSMTEKDKITQILMPAFRYWKDSNSSVSNKVTELNGELSGVIKKYHFGGVILFAQNLSSTDQMVRLTNQLKDSNAAGGNNVPLLIATDQEGGSVVRLGSGCRMTGNMALGAANDEQAAYDTGDILGSELASVGINVDFAPVMDTNSNPKNPVIGLRSFSDDPARVAKLGTQMIKGLHHNNIATALKHFPGHGDTDTDSHSTMPIVYKDMDELKKTELVPFQAGMDAGSDMIMTTHIQYPKIITETLPTKNKDGNGQTIQMKPPATLSKEILTDLMRKKMHYKGVIVTDSMCMSGITDNFDSADAAIYSIKAGADIILMPCVTQSLDDIHNNLDPIIQAIYDQAQSDPDLQKRIQESAERVVQLKISRNLMKPENSSIEQKTAKAEAIVGSKEHHDREREIADEAVTVIKNNNNTLPIKPEANQKVLLIGAYSNEPPALQFGLQQLIKEKKIPSVQFQSMYYYKSRISDDDLKNAISGSDYVIAVTETSSEDELDPDNWITRNPANIVKWSKEAGKPCVLVSIDIPYDVANYQDADTMLAVYGSSGMDPTEGGNRPATNYGPNIPAAMDIVFGAYAPKGTLPVNVPKIVNAQMSPTDVQYARGYGATGSLTNVGKGQVQAPASATVNRQFAAHVKLSELQNLTQLESIVYITYDSSKFVVNSASGMKIDNSTVSVPLNSGKDLHSADISLNMQATQTGLLTPIKSVVIKDRSGRIFTPAFDNSTNISVTSSHSDKDHSGSKTHSDSTEPSTADAGSSYISDTVSDISVDAKYQFKITSRNGQIPAFVVGTPGVFITQLVKVVGNDYYYKIIAVGPSGAEAGIYINGVKVLVATVKATSVVQSDTTRPFHVKAGASYLFKLTADTQPHFAAGSPSVFRVDFVKAQGRDYLFKVTAVGKAGMACGFYINGQKTPVAVATIVN